MSNQTSTVFRVGIFLGKLIQVFELCVHLKIRVVHADISSPGWSLTSCIQRSRLNASTLSRQRKNSNPSGGQRKVIGHRVSENKDYLPFALMHLMTFSHLSISTKNVQLSIISTGVKRRDWVGMGRVRCSTPVVSFLRYWSCKSPVGGPYGSVPGVLYPP